MSAGSSLRTRLLIGALLWTAGLFAIVGVVGINLMEAHPGVLEVVHGPFRHVYPLLLLAALLMLVGLAQVHRGVSPVNQLRARLQDVRDGREEAVTGRYPSEVQPLVDDLNALLDHRDQATRRAQAQAGDLAHGLKTPLAVLAHEAGRARAAGHAALAARLDEQIARMERQVAYHLTQARAAASGAAPGTRCPVSESAEALVRTLSRLHADRGVSIVVEDDGAAVARVQRQDLDEMLGNLLDNACKWASARVVLSVSRAGDRVVIDVDDDGAGLPEAMRQTVLQRGVRADEAGGSAGGAGLGLAIVRDLAVLYGGSIELGNSPLGGLRARLALPAATSETA